RQELHVSLSHRGPHPLPRVHSGHYRARARKQAHQRLFQHGLLVPDRAAPAVSRASLGRPPPSPAMNLLRGPSIVIFSESAAEALHGGYDKPVSWMTFHKWRNSVIRALSPYGTIGPMGERPLGRGEKGRNWPITSSDCDFFVVDDQWSAGQKWIDVETDAGHLSRELLMDICHILRADAEWAVNFAMGVGHLVVFSHLLMVGMPLFQECKTFDEIICACECSRKSKEKKP